MNIYNFNHLYYFYVTAKLNGVTVAAKKLNTSQSSLSTQLKTLESVLGRRLFKKSGRNIELTDFGKEIHSYCRRSFEVFDEMFDQIKKPIYARGIRVTVGVSPDVERPYITEAVTAVNRNYQKGHKPLLNLLSLSSHDLLNSLRFGEIDLLLTTNVTVDHGIVILDRFDLPVSVIASREYIQKNKLNQGSDLLRKNMIPFVLPSKLTSIRGEIDDYFARRKIYPNCVFESNIISSVVRSVSDGLGISILPTPYIYREVRRKEIMLMSEKPLWKHTIFLVGMRNRLDEKRIEFAKYLSQVIKDLNQR